MYTAPAFRVKSLVLGLTHCVVIRLLNRSPEFSISFDLASVKQHLTKLSAVDDDAARLSSEILDNLKQKNLPEFVATEQKIFYGQMAYALSGIFDCFDEFPAERRTELYQTFKQSTFSGYSFMPKRLRESQKFEGLPKDFCGITFQASPPEVRFIYSLNQAQVLLEELKDNPEDLKELQTTIERCGLPETSTSELVKLNGTVAELILYMYWIQYAVATQRA